MEISQDELIEVLSQFNPWWRDEPIEDIPDWHRSAFTQLWRWLTDPPVQRALLISGARQIGKTTLMRQAIQRLLNEKVSPGNILYATFDHPLLKLGGIEAILKAWQIRKPIQTSEPVYLFLDEAHFIQDFGTWVKHQVDFKKNWKIVVTGSIMPLLKMGQESGVGRWKTIKLNTLSFFEYLQLRKEDYNALPPLTSLKELFEWDPEKFYQVIETAGPYAAYFNEYLLRGGFPQILKIESVTEAQRLLREDVVDKVLKRDMTALFKVRSVLELEKTFLYLCLNEGGLLDMKVLCDKLETTRPTAQSFIDLLEAAHLIYRLQPLGYGKEVLRAKSKIYLADPAIAPAVLLQGKKLLDNPIGLGRATETAVFKHLFSRYYDQAIRFSYWRNAKEKGEKEVDLIAEFGEKLVPFEIKYRSSSIKLQDFKGLLELCQQKSIDRAYIITKSLEDFGLLPSFHGRNLETQIMRIPAPFLCYWMGVE